MRKISWVPIIAILLSVVLGGCSSKTVGASQSATSSAAAPSITAATSASAAVSPKASDNKTSPKPSASTEPSKSAQATASGAAAQATVTYDAATVKYFGGDVDAALKNMRPMLLTAAATEVVFKTDLFYAPELQKGNDFAWNMMYRYINTYCFNDTNVKKVKGDLIISSEVMKGYFTTLFADFDGSLPNIPSNLTKFVKYDADAAAYTVSEASGDEYATTLKELTLSKAASATDPTMTAVLTFDVTTPADGKSVGTVSIEVLPSSNAYKFTIQSVSMAG